MSTPPEPSGGPASERESGTGADAPILQDFFTEDPPPHPRRCQGCFSESATTASHCPQCGTPYDGAPPSEASWKTLAIVGSVILLVLAVVIGCLMWLRSTDEDANPPEPDPGLTAQQPEGPTAADLAAAAERRRRARIVKRLVASVEGAAKESVASGALEGPIMSTSCAPVPGSSIDELEDEVTRFTCIAVTQTTKSGATGGYGFKARINWIDGTYTFTQG